MLATDVAVVAVVCVAAVVVGPFALELLFTFSDGMGVSLRTSRFGLACAFLFNRCGDISCTVFLLEGLREG